MSALPAPRTPGRYRVAFICSGNICRSPSAEVVAAHLVAEAGLDDRVEVASGGIGDWHVGNPMDSRSAAALTARGYDPSSPRASQVRAHWFDDYDLVLAMDGGHHTALSELAADRGHERLRMFGELDPASPGAEVPDPYYGGAEGFEEVLDMVERTCRVLVREIEQTLSRGAPA